MRWRGLHRSARPKRRTCEKWRGGNDLGAANMTLRKVNEFTSPGMQIQSPGGLSFDPKDVSAVESRGGTDPRLRLLFRNGGEVSILFYRNVDGGPPDVYGMARRIR